MCRLKYTPAPDPPVGEQGEYNIPPDDENGEYKGGSPPIPVG
jgi:hypothetical protein